jgi:predicted alpha-1,2-mannosidase
MFYLSRLNPVNTKKYLPLFLATCFFITSSNAQQLTKYVDPFIGTGGHGHTYPGASVPFGMVQLSPDNGENGWDWCSGYHYSSDSIQGFSHTHLSGTGIGDWCDISVMPAANILQPGEYYKAKYSHANEKASPGFYQVKMDNGIQAAFTATERCGLHQYSFPATATPVLRFDLGFHINWDTPTGTYIKKLNDSTIVGYRFSKGWANVQRIYFAARTSVPVKELLLSEATESVKGKETKGTRSIAQLVFQSLNGKTLLLKVALSSVSTDKALGALSEIKGWNFNSVKASAETKWEGELKKLQIKTTDEKLKKVFYTALYHTCMAPALYSDADGTYQNVKGEVLKMQQGQRYTEFSLWDTFRAEDPLFSITQPKRIPDFINTMMVFYKENGLLPIWDLSTWETNTMTGYHAIPVLADAILKDIQGINAAEIFEAMKKSAMQNIRGTDVYRQYGYVPQDKYGSSVTVTVEYSYDDWCIAQVAKKLGQTADYETYMKRSASWKNLFDPSTGFIRAKNADGNWVTPFDPYLSEHDEKKAMYTEGNAWQHSFFVPHDVTGLAKAHGSTEKFILKLDSLFTVSSEIKGENKSPDVSGLIGQYAHGNEPSHHIAYMYSFVGDAWKTQERVKMIVDSMYRDQPDGYAGNEDCGQMSAWGVWSMMGIYPGNPSSGQYVFGTPMMDEVQMQLPSRKTMLLRAKNRSANNFYIQSVQLNGKVYNKTYIDHTTLLKGGTLVFTMGSAPNKQFGSAPETWPASASGSN